MGSSLHQAPLCMGFSRQEYWSGLPFPSPGNLPDPGIEPRSLALWTDALPSEPPGKFLGVGNGNPLQYSCLETSMDRGAQWAIDHGVEKSQKRHSTYVHILLHMCSISLCGPAIFIHPVKGSTDFFYKDTIETCLCLLTPTPLFPSLPPPCNYLKA